MIKGIRFGAGFALGFFLMWYVAPIAVMWIAQVFGVEFH